MKISISALSIAYGLTPEALRLRGAEAVFAGDSFIPDEAGSGKMTGNLNS